MVAGAGHNSLICAAYLAKAGNRVLVLEGRAMIGGGVKTAEILLPGFKQDLCSSSHHLIARNPLLRNNELDLRDYGYETFDPEVVVHFPFLDGASLTVFLKDPGAHRGDDCAGVEEGCGNVHTPGGHTLRTELVGGRERNCGVMRLGEGVMEVEMKIRGLMMDPVTNMPIVILKDLNGNSVLPIWVGVYEANAIALEIEKVVTPRPMTHDLIKTLLLGLNAGLRKVVVSELKDDTFYAVIWLDRDGELISVDSRPSDALALALRLDCPIYVDDCVLKSSKSQASVADKVNNNEELRRWLEGLNDEDLGRYKM